MSLYEIGNLAVEIAGKRLVEDVSLTVEAGQCTAIIGASGSGKSLTCLTPFGLSPGIASGAMILDGVDLASADAHQLRNARSRRFFQDGCLHRHLQYLALSMRFMMSRF